MKKKFIFLLLIIMLLPIASEAQCSMCRAVLETETSQNAAKGINDGIMYLMVFPYLLMGGVAYFVWRSFQNKGKNPQSS
ncbi:hypothetical protein [Salinimicrobium sp. GXAS 041]|uniref:hypothetical protein n=1 Tax=Salinimicrobium sp. GXAS 041 TaxID=3400806 RepID=UPI003C72A594